MKIKDYLYSSITSKWPNGNIWLYSDPHFGDPDMPILRKNNISDEEQVKRINSKVGKNDTIIFLGDIGDTDFIKRIRGYKILITGNHDLGASNYLKTQVGYTLESRYIPLAHKEQVDKIRKICEQDPFTLVMFGEWLNNHYARPKYENAYLFDEVYTGVLTISKNIILSHEPIANEFPYALNIYGHDHSCVYHVENNNGINVCAENINYSPVSLKTIIESGAIKNIPDIHRTTIDRAIERKLPRKDVKED